MMRSLSLFAAELFPDTVLALVPFVLASVKCAIMHASNTKHNVRAARALISNHVDGWEPLARFEPSNRCAVRRGLIMETDTGSTSERQSDGADGADLGSTRVAPRQR